MCRGRNGNAPLKHSERAPRSGNKGQYYSLGGTVGGTGSYGLTAHSQVLLLWSESQRSDGGTFTFQDLTCEMRISVPPSWGGCENVV